jgi:hypothetical protein
VLTAVARKGGVASQWAFNRAYKWQTRMAQGSETDLRTPYFAVRSGKKGLSYPPRNEIVSGLTLEPYAKEPHLSSILLSDEFEYAERDGIGPMSKFLPWEKDGHQKAKAVYSDKSVGTQFRKMAWLRALDRLQALIPSNSSPVLSIQRAIDGEASGKELTPSEFDGMDTKTNSGSPWFIRPWKPSPEANPKSIPEIVEAYKWYIERVTTLYQELNSSGSVRLPYHWAIAGQRLVQKGPELTEKSKRLVIAYPKDEAILWKMITPPIMEKLREIRLDGGVRIMCGWYNTYEIDMDMQLMLEQAQHNDRVVMSGDVSNYDSSLPPTIILDVGKILASWIRGHSRLTNRLVYMMLYKTHLITPDKIYEAQPSSLKSGSGCTNLIGSLCNIALQFYGEEIGLYKIHNLAVLGDDFVIDGSGCSAESTEECFNHFNMNSHPDKQFVHERALAYLKRVHYLGIPGGIASVYRTLGSVLSLERMQFRPEDWNEDSYTVRTLSQLQNCVHSPWFEQLTRFVMSGDRGKLGADIANPDVIAARAGKSGAEMIQADIRRPWKNQDNATSFRNWAVNGVVRGRSLPPIGRERHALVYGKST